MTGLKRVLGVADVALFNVTVVFSVRGLATAAKFGPAALPLWLLAVVTFFVPLALAIDELATRDPGEGGFYRWVRDAFGDQHGFIAGWCYWLSNLTYLPSLLIVFIGCVAEAIGRPEVGTDPRIAAALSLVMLALLTALAVRGLSAGRVLTGLGAALSWLVAAALIAAGAVAAWRFGPASDFSASGLMHTAGGLRTFGWFGTLSLALVGLELAPLLGGEIREPRRTIPRAIALSGVVICALYLAGTAAILVALPPEDVSPITGALGAIRAVGERAGMGWMHPFAAVALAVATLAGFAAWLAAMARLPYAAGIDRFLPPALARLHPRFGTPARAIVLQAALAAVLVVLGNLGAGVDQAFQILMNMTVVLNFVPFLYLFLALPVLRPRGKSDDEPGVVRIPGGRLGLRTVAALGLASTAATLLSTALPTSEIEDPWVFEASVWGGLLAFGVAGRWMFRRYAARA